MAVKSKTSSTSVKKKNAKGKYKSKLGPLLSNTKKPDHLTAIEWQTILRKQIAERSVFKISNIGDGLVYSDYHVYNSGTKNTYKVALRTSNNSLNYCSCYDFKTNQLGTCKHIEAVLLYIHKKPALRKLLPEPYSTGYSSMYLQYRGERNVVFRIGTEDTAAYQKLLKPYVDKNSCLTEKGFKKIDWILKQAYKINVSFRCYEDALSYIIQEREQSQRQELLLPYIRKNQLPIIKSLRVKPFPYQTEGILFCAAAGRSILADDMGLGKTVQAIGVAQLMHEQLQIQKVLVICPTSLKYQWQSEIEKFCTSAVQVIEGNYLKRREQYEQEGCLYKIVSYHAAVNDRELIDAYQPDLIILDEAQRIKNWQTRVSQSMKKLKSKYALVLTGTPLENKVQELYSLVQFINPLLLGSLHHFTSQHEQTDDTGKVIGYKDLHLIKKRLKAVLLRRTKKEVLTQLPERIDKNLFVDITSEQRIIHQEYMEVVSKLVNRWKRMGFLREEERQRLLICLNMMRMVCNSTYVLDQKTNYQTKLDELFNILDEIINNGTEKIVIFSQWERFTRLIALELDRLQIGYTNLNGNIPSRERKDLFDRFNNEPACRIFLSTDAGGTGLNLQKASILINMDLPWNPAVLEQRIGRIYRQGQTKNINVINFIAQNTIEHGMLGKLKFKTALAEGVLDNGEANIFIGDSKFNVFMQTVQELFTEESVARTASAPLAQQEEIVTETRVMEPEASPVLFEDDDAATPLRNSKNVQGEDVEANPEKQLLQTTSSFISQLTSILGDSGATDRLAKSLTRKDEHTGQTYLQIPVENEAVIKNAMALLAGLFKNITG